MNYIKRLYDLIEICCYAKPGVSKEWALKTTLSFRGLPQVFAYFVLINDICPNTPCV
jgi:hypothetical protein